MKKHLLHIVIFFCITQQLHPQQDGVVAFDIPARNSLKFNRYVINPTFSFVRESNKYLSFNNKREWTQFDNPPQTYLFSYAGRFQENMGMGIGLFQQNYGVLTTFGGVVNYAYNVILSRENNLTFGINAGFYQSTINDGKVITNFPDPSLANIEKNSLITINPGINYGFGQMDIGLAFNNAVLYNLSSSEILKDNPQQGLLAHIMYTGFLESSGFFDQSKFSTLIRSEFGKEDTVISGLVMLSVPKGVWTQLGYNTQFGISGGIGFNITSNIAIEYNYEKSIGDFSALGNSHDITLAYKFNNKKRYYYNDEVPEEGLISGSSTNKRSKPAKAKTVDPDTKAKADAARQAKKEADDKAKLEEEAKEQERIAELERIKEEEEIKAKEEAAKSADQKAKQEAEEKARQDAIAKEREEAAKQAKLAEERSVAEKARIAAQERAKQQAEEKARQEEAARQAQEEAARQAQEDAERRAQVEADRKAQEEAQRKAQEEADRIAQEEADRIAQEEADRIAKEEAERKAEEEAAERERLAEIAKAEEEERLRKEAEALALQEAELKAQKEAEAQAAIEENNPTVKSIKTLTATSTDYEQKQQELIRQFQEKIAVKRDYLKDLKEENDLGDQGIFNEPKPFRSLTAENNAIRAIRADIQTSIDEQGDRLKKLEQLYATRLQDVPDRNEEINVKYANQINELKLKQAYAVRTNELLVKNLERIEAETEVERKRRIKRAAYDNETDRYNKDRAALEYLRRTTQLSSVPYKTEDFDFGITQSNIQILKNVNNIESGYYLVVAVHTDVAKRDEFITKALASGQTDIDFFFDVKTSKYYIYYDKHQSIESAERALSNKSDKPYNAKMSMVRIENE